MGRRFTPDEHEDLDVRLGETWRDNHRYLLSVAFRILGTISEAEDVVQEGFARLVDADRDAIDDVRGWLVVVVSRLCFDQLRSARWQRQVPATSASEHRAASDSDPADRVTLDDEVRLALHVVMARLTPAERTAFVLHDVFDYSFEDVGAVVGRSPAACRQLATRARRHLRTDGGSARSTVESAEKRRVADEFITACSTGDLERLLSVLDPDVEGGAAPGGALGPRRPIVGQDAVARLTLHYLGPKSSTTLLLVPTGDEPTVVAIRDRRVIATLALSVEADLIHHIRGVFDPAELADLNITLGL